MNRGLLGYPQGRGQYQKGLGFPLNSIRGAPKHESLSSVAADMVGGAANTKGNWAGAGRPNFTADGFTVVLIGTNAIADFLIDVAVGDGQEEVIVQNFLYNTGTGGFGPTVCMYHFPMKVEAGRLLSFRCQSTDGAVSPGTGGVAFHRGEPYRSLRCRRSQTYGATLADSGGTSIDPGGSANTFGAWVELTDRTVDPVRNMLVCMGGQNSVRSDADHFFEIGIGPPGSEVAVCEQQYFRQNSTSDCFMPSARNLHVSVPAGVRLAARTRASITGATARLVDILVVGFGP